MAEQAFNIAREAKGLHQGLKDALKSRKPWDKEVEFQRKNLRQQYLRLLLVYPYAKESKDAETHLWMQTSHTFISIYKQSLSSLDHALTAPPNAHQPRQERHGPVEYRKLMQRFRQFLSDEEKFWTQLVVRFRRSFDLTEAQPALVSLGIQSATVDPADNLPDASGSAPHPRDATNAIGRNPFQFLEDNPPSVLPKSDAEREGRLVILSKALVCLGDIARYKELYNESGGRPKAGIEESLAGRKNVRGKGGNAMLPARARNYDKALQCYEQARFLAPNEGNPSHQLGILASYQKDNFASIVHYYRALCVRQPYDTAAENLGTVLTKALEQWKVRMRRESDNGGSRAVDLVASPRAPRLRVDLFKERIVVLHALWRLGAEKMDGISPKHTEATHNDFLSLVSERVLPIDLISKTVVLAQGALWKHKKFRDSNMTAASAAAIEHRIHCHLLGLHQALMEIGTDQLAEAPPEDPAANDLAQRITATFRRTLPALRIAGKWLRANFKYVLYAKSMDTKAFWKAYTRFSTALEQVFPVERLPVLNSPLDEDKDMRGFRPLKDLMAMEMGRNGDDQSAASARGQQVHPNVEQLMRIADLLEDANALVKMEDSLIVYHNGSYFPRGSEIIELGTDGNDSFQSIRQASMRPPDALFPDIRGRALELARSEEFDEDARTETTDPVADAFRQVLDGSERDFEADEEDEIVWDPRARLSPLAAVASPTLPSPPTRPSPVTPMRSSFSPMTPIGPPKVIQTTPPHVKEKARSPFVPNGQVVMPPTVTTAQDLLNKMRLQRPSVSQASRPQSHQESSAPQPQLLFGSGPPDHPGHSIWSTSLDDSSLHLQTSVTNNHLNQPLNSPTNQGLLSSPPNLSQSIWSSSYPNGSQSSQHHLAGALPAASFIPQLQSIVGGDGHQRMVSTSLFSSHQYTNANQSPNQYDGAYANTFTPQIPQSYGSATRNAMHGSYADFGSSSVPGAGMLYGQGDISSYHSSHMQRHNEGGFVPQVSQIWGAG